MPELRLVVLALQDRLAYGSTFEAALASLFTGANSSLAPAEPQHAAGPPSASDAKVSSADLHPTIAEAAKDFAEYQRLTAEGKLAEAGQKLQDLKRDLDKLNISPK